MKVVHYAQLLIYLWAGFNLKNCISDAKLVSGPGRPKINIVYSLCKADNMTGTCGDRGQELMTSIWSALLSSQKSQYELRIYSFVDPEIQSRILQLSQDLLPAVDAVIYLDASTIILQPLDTLWESFHKFSDQQMFAHARKSAIRKDEIMGNTLPAVRGVTYAPNIGVQSGVTLMNLTRLRQKHFTNEIAGHYNFLKNDGSVSFDGNDLLNVYLYNNLEYLYILPCQLHYTHEFCKSGNETCPAVEENGVTVLQRFNTNDCKGDTFPSIESIYKAYNNLALKESFGTELDIDVTSRDNCSSPLQRIRQIAIKRFRSVGK